MGAVSVRKVGGFQMTAHVAPQGEEFLPEVLVSGDGGITIRCYRVPGISLPTRELADQYAKRWMAMCTVSEDGLMYISNAMHRDEP